MAATIKKMGKVAASPFGALTKGTAAKPNNKPILILIVVGGVAAIWYLRNHSSANTVGSTTNPAVSINGGSAPDQSTIDNLTASVLALQGLQPGNTTSPSGGASTPITTQPSQTNPGGSTSSSISTSTSSTVQSTNVNAGTGTVTAPISTNSSPSLPWQTNAQVVLAKGGTPTSNMFYGAPTSAQIIASGIAGNAAPYWNGTASQWDAAVKAGQITQYDTSYGPTTVVMPTQYSSGITFSQPGKFPVTYAADSKLGQALAAQLKSPNSKLGA